MKAPARVATVFTALFLGACQQYGVPQPAAAFVPPPSPPPAVATGPALGPTSSHVSITPVAALIPPKDIAVLVADELASFAQRTQDDSDIRLVPLAVNLRFVTGVGSSKTRGIGAGIEVHWLDASFSHDESYDIEAEREGTIYLELSGLPGHSDRVAADQLNLAAALEELRRQLIGIGQSASSSLVPACANLTMSFHLEAEKKQSGEGKIVVITAKGDSVSSTHDSESIEIYFRVARPHGAKLPFAKDCASD